MAKKDYKIDPSAGSGPLKILGVPYSVFASSFNLENHIRTIDCNYLGSKYKSETVVISEDAQLEQWLTCVKSATSGEATGWTLGISGPGTIKYPEMTAAYLALKYLQSNRRVAWINITSSIYSQRELEKLVGQYTPLDMDAFIFTGLRWEANDVRFDKTFDLIRDTPAGADRIIVGCGEDPIAISRRMGVSIQRAVCVTDSHTIQM